MSELRATLDAMCASAARSKEIESMSDAEVAALLFKLTNEIPMFDALHDVLVQAEGRLRRANRGPYRECSFCQAEATSGLCGDGQWRCAAHMETR